MYLYIWILKGTLSLSLFPCDINKFHQMCNQIGQKDAMEQNRSGCLEIRGSIARMEVDYSSSNLIS